MTVISLLTDFGTQDEYVGVVKGVILGINPAATIVDLSHAVAPQDVPAAAYLIKSAFRYFPRGSVHVTIVDPGVGSRRAIVAARMGGHTFVAPDNGILSLLLVEEHPEQIVSVTNEQWFLQPVSRTFHGRDIFAPVAGHLSLGVDLASLGLPMNSGDLVRLPFSHPSMGPSGRLEGVVVTVDRFGNLVTNIDMPRLQPLVDQAGDRGLIIEVGGRQIDGLAVSYSHYGPGGLLAIAGSRDCLEIAVNMGNAAEILNVKPGAPVQVWLARGKGDGV
jgi:S-adenosylmethionine hydrolase